MYRIHPELIDGFVDSMLAISPKPKLAVSFSGGETSAYMTWLVLDLLTPLGFEIVVIFANTGQENEETLKFVRGCDTYLGFNTVWVEAEIDPKHGSGPKPRIVTFETASRDGRPFREMIEKYGIPNTDFPHCSRVLKKQVIRAYFRKLKWKKYYTLIGIRADEFDRASADAEKERLVYPFIPLGVTKPDVNLFWSEQPFRLQLKGYQGNCKWCWKKSFRKLMTILSENPEAFDFPREMEELFSEYRPESQPNRPLPARFFRENKTVDDLEEMANRGFTPAGDDSRTLPAIEFSTEVGLDVQSGCEESCEAF